MKACCPHLPTVLLLLSTFIIWTNPVWSQARSEHCDTDSLTISTGWDRLEDTVEVFDKTDSWWKVERVASGSTHQLFLPVYAPIIPYAQAIPVDDSRWIGDVGPYSDSISVDYRFTTEFCLTSLVEFAQLDCKLLSNGRVRVILNSIELQDAALEELSDRYDPLHIKQEITAYLRPGKNVLQIEVSEAIGRNAIALSGSILATSTEDSTPFSCDECGQIVPDRR